MKRLGSLLVAASTLAGCYAEYVPASAPPTAYVEGGTVSVGMAPPPPRYEPVVGCGYNQTWIGGFWDWGGGSWAWQPGYCQAVRPGYTWVAPVWSGGVYRRGYWGPAGGVYGRQRRSVQTG